MNSERVKQLEKEHVMQTYGRCDLVITNGDGAYVFDDKGKRYLDFIGGIACVPCGHANKEINGQIIKQLDNLVHISNLYYTEPMVTLAERLAKISGLKKCFFANSGTEANEAAIKLAKKVTGKHDFIVCDHAFHGRTHASLSATWKENYRRPFYPLVDGFKFVEYDNLMAIDSVIGKDTAAVMIEPIQGEAGVIVPDKDYLKKLRELCRQKNILLILDEVQTGNARTGKYFAYQHSGIIPDIVTTAKGLANGLPIGVCLSNFDFGKGDHASTFGGNCICAIAALATIDYIEKHALMQNASKVGQYFISKAREIPGVKEIRGIGLMIAIEIEADAKWAAEECQKKGLLLNNVSATALRILPPLTITEEQADEAIEIIRSVLNG